MNSGISSRPLGPSFRMSDNLTLNFAGNKYSSDRFGDIQKKVTTYEIEHVEVRLDHLTSWSCLASKSLSSGVPLQLDRIPPADVFLPHGCVPLRGAGWLRVVVGQVDPHCEAQHRARLARELLALVAHHGFR